MRLAVVSVGAVVLAGMLLAAPALAARGVNLSWSRCHGDGGTQARTFACDTNGGTEVLVCSFVLDEPVAQVTGNEIVIDLLWQDAPIPEWWAFRDVGSCRENALGVNTSANVNDVACADWAAGNAASGIGAYDAATGSIDPNLWTRHRRLKIALAVPLPAVTDLVPDTEYFSCNITITHAKTVGTAACAGCPGSVCMVLNQFKVITMNVANDVILGVSSEPGSNMVQWQGTGADCNLVPVKRSTWGQVKGLYR